jgi:hypothetical protein
MRFKDFKQSFLIEFTRLELDSLKKAISGKIKDLPADDVTIKALREIEDLLRDVNAGGRKGMIEKALKTINDPAVLAAQKMLARYILSIDAEPADRQEFFDLWKTDKIVNIDRLLSNERVTFSNIFATYDSNPMTKEFVDEVMNVDALGHGKGEFGLNVLSKRVWKPADNKGDLKMEYKGKTWQIECKTESGGAARFGDQEVRPAEGYEQAAIALNKFVTKHKTAPMKLSGSGMNLNQAVAFHQSIKAVDQKTFMGLVRNCLTLIFGNLKDGRPVHRARLKKNVNDILNAIEMGNGGNAAQAYSQASFNYYMSRKEDDGILYTNLNTGTFIFYDDAQQLMDQGLRFHASTPYISATKDPVRSVYPQISVQPTTFGATSARADLKKLSKGNAPLTAPDFNASLVKWAQTLANRRGVTNQRIISGMAINAMKMIQQKMSSEDIIAELEKMYPQLVPKVAVAPTPPAPAAAIPAPVAPQKGTFNPTPGGSAQPAVPATMQAPTRTF